MFVKILSSILLLLFFSFTFVPSAQAYRPYLQTDTAVPLDRGKSRFEIGLQHKRINRDRNLFALIGEWSFGLTNNVETEVEFPYRFLRVNNVSDVQRGPAPLSDLPSDEDGMGDINLKAKVRFIKGREVDPLSIAGQLTIKVPTCDKEKDLSSECTGEPDLDLTIIASKEFFPFKVDFNLGHTFVGNPEGTKLDDSFHYSVGLDMQTLSESLRVAGELGGGRNREPDADSDLLFVMGGIIYNADIDKLLDLSLSIGLTGDTPDYTLSFGFTYLY